MTLPNFGVLPEKGFSTQIGHITYMVGQSTLDAATTASVFIVLVCVQAVFAVWPVTVKMAFEEKVGVFELSLMRDVAACVILWVVTVTEDATSAKRPITLRTILLEGLDERCLEKSAYLFLLLGMCSFANSFGYLVALLYVTPFNSALLHPTIPVFASVMGAVVGVSPLTRMKVVGTAICVVGSVFVVLSQPSDDGDRGASTEDVTTVSSLFIGNMLLVVQSLAMATLLVYQKFVPSSYSPLKTTAMYYSVGTAISLPPSLIIISMTQTWVLPTGTILWVVLFGSLFVVGFNYAALTWANKLLSPAIPAASMMLQPPLSYFASRLFISGTDNAGWLQVVGGLVIVAGLLVALSDSAAPSGATVEVEDGGTSSPDTWVGPGAGKGSYLYAATPHEADEVKGLLSRGGRGD